MAVCWTPKQGAVGVLSERFRWTLLDCSWVHRTLKGRLQPTGANPTLLVSPSLSAPPPPPPRT